MRREQVIVVKLGTSVLTGGTDKLDKAHMVELVRQCSELKKQGHQVILVSSGAVAAGREQLIKPCGRGLVLEVLRYADEVTRAQTYFRSLPETEADADLLDLATTIIDKKTGPFKPEEFHDRYVDALHQLIDKKKKAKGKRVIEDVEEDAPSRGGNVIDLMAALKKSVGDGGASSKKSATKKTTSRSTGKSTTSRGRSTSAGKKSA